MRRTIRVVALLAGVTGACGGDDEPTPHPGGAATEAPGSSGGSPPGPPPPAVPAASGTHTKLFPAGAALLGRHATGCSQGQAPAGTAVSRWCAVSVPGAAAGRLELWVINVSAAAAPGADVRCDGTSPDCLRLSEDLFGDTPPDGPAYPTSHEFHGDTLIYYADNDSQGFDLYQGPVYAWRPGWPAGRAITGRKGVLCAAHQRAPVAVCIENLSDISSESISWDLHAGPVDGGPTKKLATIYPFHPDTGASQSDAAFTQQGDYLLYSTPPSPTGQETLYQVKTSEIGAVAPTMVGAGLSHWNVNAAGTQLYYLRDHRYLPGEPSGMLHTSAFPAGGGERRVAGSQLRAEDAGLAVYQVLVDAKGSDGGLGFLSNLTPGRADYRVLNDPAGSYDDPANVTTVITDMLLARLPVFSQGLGHALFTRNGDDFVGTTDAWVVKRDGTGACALTTSVASWLFGYPFVSEGGLVMWADNYDQLTDAGEGWLANADGCSDKRRFAVGIDYWFVKHGALVLYSDDSDGTTVTLRAAHIDGGRWPDTVTEIKRGVDRKYAVVGDYEGVVYKVVGDGVAAGLYHYQL
jgi:hypothetical protein